MAKNKNSKRPPMSADEKKKKFGDKYDPNYKPSKKKSTKREQNEFGDEVPDRNDWKFYAYSDQVAKDIASLPFNNMSGVRYVLRTMQGSTSANIPAILRIRYCPSIGQSSSKVDGINMAATKMYSFIRHSNSGAKNYEAPDAMMYVLAMKDIYGAMAEAKRAMGAINYFNFYNRNIPDLLVSAMGVDPDDLRANIAQYRGRYNILVQKVNSFAVPSYFKAFDRQAYIASKVFGDSDSIRGQFYVFTRDTQYTWSGKTDEHGTELVPTEINLGINTLRYMGEILNTIETQINAMLTDEDCNIISGDILKAFDVSNLYALTEISDDYVVIPEMDEDILAQIENSVAISDISLASKGIGQSNLQIIFTPSVPKTSVSNGLQMQSLILNSHKDDPQYTDVLEWTRLMSLVDLPNSDETNVSTEVRCFGLEIVEGYDVIWYGYSNEGVQQLNSLPFVNQLPRSMVSSGYIAVVLLLMQFDWHPILYVFDTSANNTIDSIYPAGDLKVSTVVELDTLQKMHECAAMSAFYADDLYAQRRKA